MAAVRETVAESGTAVKLRGVSRRHRLDDGRTLEALASVGLDVAPGEILAVSGPSGSGKSTLLNVVGAIERPDEGTVDVGGRELRTASRKELTAHRRGVGFVFQRFNLLPALTALDNVLAPVLPYRVDFDKPGRGRELLAAVGLAGRETALPSRLSGGQQQRVAIARALINRPKLLLADEPTGNLDSRTGAEIMDLMLGLREEHGMTILVATHDPSIAALADRVLRLVDGRVAGEIDVGGATDLEATRERLARPAPR